MSTTLLAVFTALSICLCIGLTASLIMLGDSYRKLRRILGDTYALQRMVTTHGDAQLRTDGRLDQIDQQLERLQKKNLQMQSFIAGLSSIENAASMIEDSGANDVERLAIQNGLTEREADLMIKLRGSYAQTHSTS